MRMFFINSSISPGKSLYCSISCRGSCCKIKRTIQIQHSYDVLGGNMNIELIAVLLAVTSYVLSSLGVDNTILIIVLIAVLAIDFLDLDEVLGDTSER